MAVKLSIEFDESVPGGGPNISWMLDWILGWFAQTILEVFGSENAEVVMESHI